MQTEIAVSELGITEIVVVGGTAAVSVGVQEGLDALSGVDTTRVAGATRYQTAALFAAFALDQAWSFDSYVGVATGSDFPDALGGGVVAGANGGTLVLTGPTVLPAETRAFLEESGHAGTPVRVFGGIAVISDAILQQLAAIPVI
jgi:hypothetical protein